jgi:hypothetical protein
MKLSPLCSGSLHEQYLTYGKPACRCDDRIQTAADPMGPGCWVNAGKSLLEAFQNGFQFGNDERKV